MASEINPSLTPTKSLDNFRFWCQKVLPLVYDDSLSYYEVLGKMVVQLNDVIDDVNADTENVLTLKDAFLELQTYVNEFFDDIDQLASYAERAEDAQTAANASAINAAASASNASASSLAAMNARDAAVAAKEVAETSASTASTAATNANTKASEAAQSAITAQTAQASASQSATLAATDRSAAQTAASTATTKANEAASSAATAEGVLESIPDDYSGLSSSYSNFSVAEMTPLIKLPTHLVVENSGLKLTVEKNELTYEQMSANDSNTAINILTGEQTPTTITLEYLEEHGIKIPAHMMIKLSSFILESNIVNTSFDIAIRLYTKRTDTSTWFNNITLTRDAGTYLENDAYLATEFEQYILPIFFRTGSSHSVGTKVKTRFNIKTIPLKVYSSISENRFVSIGDEVFKTTQPIATGGYIVPNTNAVNMNIGSALNSML